MWSDSVCKLWKCAHTSRRCAKNNTRTADGAENQHKLSHLSRKLIMQSLNILWNFVLFDVVTFFPLQSMRVDVVSSSTLWHKVEVSTCLMAKLDLTTSLGGEIKGTETKIGEQKAPENWVRAMRYSIEQCTEHDLFRVELLLLNYRRTACIKLNQIARSVKHNSVLFGIFDLTSKSHTYSCGHSACSYHVAHCPMPLMTTAIPID